MNPYDVLGVEKEANYSWIRAAYRKLSTLHHPDKEGGDREKFEELKLAFDILSNPERRDRYDKTGRLDISPITPEKVRHYLDSAMQLVINAQRPDGTTDDPNWEDIKTKIIISLKGARVEINQQVSELSRKLKRVDSLIARFKSKTEADPVGEILRERRKGIQEDIDKFGDAIELSLEAEAIINTYDYEVGPGPEGQHSPGPTLRLSRGRAGVLFGNYDLK